MNLPVPLTKLVDPAVAIVAVGDPGRTRTVLASILFLVAIGIGLVALAAWLIRSTRVDPEVLAPLEVMSERAWRRADPVWQRRRLDEVRPDGAQPLDPTVPPPATDAEFDRGPQATGFDDFDDLLRRFGVDLASTASDSPAPADHAPAAEPPLDEDDVPMSPPVTIDPPDAADDADEPGEPEPAVATVFPPPTDAGDVGAGDVTAGDVPAGDVTAGDVTAGDGDAEHPDEHERVDAHDRG